MKEKILKLREEGKSYRDIAKELNCNTSLISYYCGEGQKEKRIKSVMNRKKNNPLAVRVETFKYNGNKRKRNLVETTRKFQKRDGNETNSTIETSFNYKDVLNKFGEETNCYLTGDKINLLKDNNYQFDHIIPASRGGNNSLENLGILLSEVNYMKRNLTKEEFLQFCKKVLEYNGYTVTK